MLIKAVVQALLTYSMSYFKLPLGLCHELESLIVNFGGNSVEIVEKIIRLNGGICVNPN